MARKILVYFPQEVEGMLRDFAKQRNRSVTSVVVDAVDWYLALALVMHESLRELREQYPHQTSDAIVRELIYQYHLRKQTGQDRDSRLRQILEIVNEIRAMVKQND